MKIEVNGNIVTIHGNIKSIKDHEDIKSVLDGLKNSYKTITLNVVDSISMTSSVIGYLMKLANDGITININVNDDLFKLLSDLNLTSLFNVRKV